MIEPKSQEKSDEKQSDQRPWRLGDGMTPELAAEMDSIYYAGPPVTHEQIHSKEAIGDLSDE